MILAPCQEHIAIYVGYLPWINFIPNLISYMITVCNNFLEAKSRLKNNLLVYNFKSLLVIGGRWVPCNLF